MTDDRRQMIRREEDREDDNYSKREIDIFMENIQGSLTRIELSNKGMNEKIDAHILSTDKRVGRLENWRWFIMGGLAIIALVLLPIVFLLISKLF